MKTSIKVTIIVFSILLPFFVGCAYDERAMGRATLDTMQYSRQRQLRQDVEQLKRDAYFDKISRIGTPYDY